MPVKPYDAISVQREGPIDWLTLNRPDSLNAINPMMVRELWDYFSNVDQDPECRVIIFRGEGRAFCAGLDLKSQQQDVDAQPEEVGNVQKASLPGIILKMRSCPQPVIALVQGPACGGGLNFALAADVRIASVSARMNVAFVKLGLSGCELGTSFYLPRILGLSVASELMMTGRFIAADRALATGLVSSVVSEDELIGAGRAIAEEMLLASPLGLRKTKEVLSAALRVDDLATVMTLEEHAQMLCMREVDFQSNIANFANRGKKHDVAAAGGVEA